jgi:hypothetical protein
MDLNMKCEEFKANVNELVFEKLAAMDKREDAMSHAALCASCALLLTESQDVQSALRSTARAETDEAHPRVRSALLTAFAQQHTTPVAAVVDIATHRTRTRITVAIMTAAAAILMVFLLRPVILKIKTTAAPVDSQAASSATAPKATAATVPSGIHTFTPEPPAVISHARPHPHVAVRESRAVATSIPRETISTKTSNEYFPLTYLASSTAMESGTVVRVQLSRAALISLGLPLGNDRTEQVLKADLIVGDDGVARAIRLVD